MPLWPKSPLFVSAFLCGWQLITECNRIYALQRGLGLQVRGGKMAYLATLQFWDRREPLIVQHRRSDNKNSSCCHCSQWGIVVWESLSAVQMCWRSAPQEFALLTQGRDSTLFCQFRRFTASASQHWEMWGNVYVPAFMFCVGSTTLLALGTVNVTRWKI